MNRKIVTTKLVGPIMGQVTQAILITIYIEDIYMQYSAILYGDGGTLLVFPSVLLTGYWSSNDHLNRSVIF